MKSSPKIAIIGAGGYVFPLVLVRDILSFPALQQSEIRLYDIDHGRAQTTLAYVSELIEQQKLSANVTAPRTRRAALEAADFVICTFQVGGLDAYRLDVEVPREYGIDQTVGDTLGPGGVFRGLRTIEVLRDLAEDIHELCPEALLLQYANPMSINCWATHRFGLSNLGLCHSVQETSRMLADEMDIPYEEITFDCAGVNHTSWFTTFRRGDQDLLHEVYETMSRRHAERGEERVRTELMRLSGYFHTESSHHASEYWAWFRKTPGLTKQYLENRWDYYEICSAHETEDRNQQLIDEAAAQGLHASYEYGSWVIDSIVTNTPRVIYGNVPNNGAITNLPSDACVEVACLVDAHGVRPVRYGSLPLACASLNNVQINVQRLAVDAALARDRSLVYAAVALDPLTSALLTLPEIREMVDRMLEAQAEWLPGFSRLSTDGARAVTSDAVRGRSDG